VTSFASHKVVLVAGANAGVDMEQSTAGKFQQRKLTLKLAFAVLRYVYIAARMALPLRMNSCIHQMVSSGITLESSKWLMRLYTHSNQHGETALKMAKHAAN